MNRSHGMSHDTITVSLNTFLAHKSMRAMVVCESYGGV